MLNFITFLQTISDSDYGYNFFSFKILKYWHAFLPVNDTIIITWPIWGLACFYQKVIVVKKNGAEGLYSMHEQGQKKPWWHKALQDTGQKKCKKEKGEKMGDRGIARIFFKGVEGGVTLFQTEGTHHFFATWIF